MKDEKMTKAKILIVEDEIIVAEDIHRSLRNMGYVTSIVSSGKEAIKEVEDNKPDLVLMDIKLPGEIDGIEATERIRALIDIPIVYITAMGDAVTVKRAKITEPFGYIHKPIDDKELLSTIEIALYRHEMDRKLRESEEKWKSLTQNTDDHITIADNNHIILYINKVIPPDTPEDVIGKSIYNYVVKEHHDVVKETLEKVFETGQPDSYEIVLDKPELGTIWLYTKVVPIKADDEVSSVILISTDITERKKTEEEVEAGRKRLEDTMESMVDDGVGIPEDLDFRKTKSLGLYLVAILAEGQLHGEIKLDRDKGTKFQIKLRGVK